MTVTLRSISQAAQQIAPFRIYICSRSVSVNPQKMRTYSIKIAVRFSAGRPTSRPWRAWLHKHRIGAAGLRSGAASTLTAS